MFTFKNRSWTVFFSGFLAYFISKFFIKLADIPTDSLNFYHFVLWFLLMWGIKCLLADLFAFIGSLFSSKVSNSKTDEAASSLDLSH